MHILTSRFSAQGLRALAVVIPILLALASCSSQKSAVNVTTAHTDTVAAKPATPAPPPVFTFFISASGNDTKRGDTYKMDTAKMMDVGTARKGKDGKWLPLSGVAYLDPKDYDTLVQLLTNYNLFTLDQADLVSNCVGTEFYKLSVWRMDANGKPMTNGARVEFSDCTLDYNLLLEPQRTGLRKLIEWFDRMRPRYRPFEPEE